MSISDVVNSVKEVYQKGNDFLLENYVKASNYACTLVPADVPADVAQQDIVTDNVSQVNSNNDLGFYIIVGSAIVATMGSLTAAYGILKNKDKCIVAGGIIIGSIVSMGIYIGYSILSK